MRHRKAGLKLNRTSSHRTAMFRNMVTSLFKHERIRTTDVKAKELRRWADNLITLAKRGDVHARRQALSIIREKKVVYKLFAEAVERYGSVSGGYTRIVKLGRRPGDAAPISLIELIYSEEGKKKKKKEKKAKVSVEKKQVVEKKEAEEKKTEEKKETTSEEEAAEEKKVILDKEEDMAEEKEVEVKTESTTESKESEAKKAEDDAEEPEAKE
ncbi:MAG: 50S ribosomal protein L17 [Deltaproteobacteria bacterium]|nr:50S ribosomal protein L17 [Deltaproteobacteria bacterium]